MMFDHAMSILSSVDSLSMLSTLPVNGYVFFNSSHLASGLVPELVWFRSIDSVDLSSWPIAIGSVNQSIRSSSI